MRPYLVLILASVWGLCCTPSQDPSNDPLPGSFQYDVALLAASQPVEVLKSRDGQAQVAVVGAYQGRVMTSTAQGPGGKSLGWLNKELIASNQYRPHINPFGGEDRFWLGPEGGQFAVFFTPGSSFSLEDWQTPGIIDTAVYDLVSQDSFQLTFQKAFELQNYSGTFFQVRVRRRIELLDPEQIGAALGIAIPTGISRVAFQSVNELTNTGPEDWSADSGLLSIWILGMFPPSDQTTVVIPLKGNAPKGTQVKDNYFGKIPSERLIQDDSTLFFLGDGNYRSKLGVPPGLAKPVMGSYDPENQNLTLVQFSLGTDSSYVNSLWEFQDEPYGGDVVNSYNDGPLDESGEQLGPFYELESSSPARELKVGETLEHVHQTFHFIGDEAALNEIAIGTLGVSINEIKSAFNGQTP